MSKVGRYLGLVKFSHSVFALPFALSSAWVAAAGAPSARVLALVVVCCVAARTAAMAFNRLVDRRLDAKNPRTAGRELPSGSVTPRAAAVLVLGSAAAFVGCAWLLNPLCGALALPVLAVLLGYSFTKRFTWLAHGVLGLALALAPLGAWLAVRGSFAGDLTPPLLLAAAVLTWVFGFDLIYACQDAEFDRREELHSIPARFGIRAALRTARTLHVATAGLLALFAWRAELGPVFGCALLGVCLLLAWEHRLVSPTDLSRVNVAFFTLNGWIGVGLFLGLWLDLRLGAR